MGFLRCRLGRKERVVTPTLTAQVESELAEILRRSANGTVTPEAVVAYARSHKASALNKRFKWNDAEAAREQRLLVAAVLLRRWKLVRVLDKPRNVRVLVSLPSDRESGAGYRDIEQVMATDELRSEYVLCGCNDIKGTAMRFASVPEMAPLVDSIVELCDEFIAAHQDGGKAAAGG